MDFKPKKLKQNNMKLTMTACRKAKIQNAFPCFALPAKPIVKLALQSIRDG